MDNKKIIIIGVILLIIAAAVIFIVITSVNYERIEITPNGTSLEVPANKTKYNGEVESAKIWTWDNGILITYNSYEDDNILKLSEVGYNALSDLIKKGEEQKIGNFTCYVINADELLQIHIFDIIKVNYNGKFYCIPLSNETTHDNVLICCKDPDIAVHIAESIKYKSVYPDKTRLDNAISNMKNVTEDLKSKANDYANNTSLDDVKSTVEEQTGAVLNSTEGMIDQISDKLPT